MAMSTEEEGHLATRERQVLWMAGYEKVGVQPGSFYTHLIAAFFSADRANTARLRRAFPITGQAMENYQSGKLAEKYGDEYDELVVEEK
jgi:hypothetical protein